MTNKPTCDAIHQEELGDAVFREVDDGWRHGSNVTEVYLREEDKTYWKAQYQRSTDGEYNGLRDGHATITLVEPYQVTVTRYRPLEQPKSAEEKA